MSISNADGIDTRFITKVFGSPRAAASVACVIFIRPGPGGVATPPDTHTYDCPPPCRPGLFEVLHDHHLVTRSKMKAPHKPPNQRTTWGRSRPRSSYSPCTDDCCRNFRISCSWCISSSCNTTITMLTNICQESRCSSQTPPDHFPVPRPPSTVPGTRTTRGIAAEYQHELIRYRRSARSEGRSAEQTGEGYGKHPLVR